MHFTTTSSGAQRSSAGDPSQHKTSKEQLGGQPSTAQSESEAKRGKIRVAKQSRPPKRRPYRNERKCAIYIEERDHSCWRWQAWSKRKNKNVQGMRRILEKHEKPDSNLSLVANARGDDGQSTVCTRSCPNRIYKIDHYSRDNSSWIALEWSNAWNIEFDMKRLSLKSNWLCQLGKIMSDNHER